MGKGKKTETKQQQQTTNTYGQITPDNTPDVQAVREWTPQQNPAIPYQFAARRAAQRSNLNNVLGGDYSPTERDQITEASDRSLGQQESEALTEEGFGLNAQQLANKQFLASLTQPRIVQTGGSSTGSVQQTENPGWGSALGGIVSAGVGLA